MKKEILYLGIPSIIECDGKCEKAWGVNTRPTTTDPEGEESFKLDAALGIAPIDPETYEGGHAKPVNITAGCNMNRWCARECERCIVYPEGGEAMAMPNF